MRRNLAGLVVVLAVLGAGVAYAAASSPARQTSRQAFLNDVAQRLGVSTSKLRAALRGAFDDQLTAAVAAGRLTSAEANAIKQHVAHGALPLGVAAGLPMGIPGTGPIVVAPAAAVPVPVPVPGHSPVAICGPAKFRLVVPRAVSPSAPAAPPTTPGSSTTPGASTTSGSTTTTPSTPGTTTTIVVTPGGSTTTVTHGAGATVITRHAAFGPWGHAVIACGGPAMQPLGVGLGLLGGLRTASSYLGLTQAKLLSDLRARRTLREIASAQGKTLDGLRSALKRQQRRRLDRLVAAGVLTRAQERAMLARRDALDQAVLSGKLPLAASAALRGRVLLPGRAMLRVPAWVPAASPGP
jgi:hypothetical protein